jgi:hypothetical protein
MADRTPGALVGDRPCSGKSTISVPSLDSGVHLVPPERERETGG